jgi:hypothetical protein
MIEVPTLQKDGQAAARACFADSGFADSGSNSPCGSRLAALIRLSPNFARSFERLDLKKGFEETIRRDAASVTVGPDIWPSFFFVQLNFV